MKDSNKQFVSKGVTDFIDTFKSQTNLMAKGYPYLSTTLIFFVTKEKQKERLGI